jgi:hypothetical protein
VEHDWHEEHKDTARQELALLLRELATKAKGRTRPQVWLDLLADEAADVDDWERAARRITQPIVDYAPSARRKIELHGESLRKETDPSVTSLLVRRIEQLDERIRQPQNSSGNAFWESDNLMSHLTVWDRTAAREQTRSHWLRLTRFHQKNEKAAAGPRGIASFTESRISLGDNLALPDYLAWISKQRPETVDDYARALLPLRNHSDDASVIKTAEELFLRQGSPWNPLFVPRRFSSAAEGFTLLSSSFLGLAPFRKQVLEQLNNEEVVGELVVTKPGKAEGKTGYNHSSISESHSLADDPRNAPVGTKISVRVCDAHAVALARAGGLPNFKLVWTLEHRNAAIRKCRETLERYGERYQRKPDDVLARMPVALPRFEPLSAPATEKDVAAGRAIFTLGTEHPVRQVPLAPLGREAIWFTSRAEPFQQTVGNQQVIAYDNRGRLWQAEEVQIDGRWRRYYGFVSAHGIAKVSAEELEFGTNYLHSKHWPGLEPRFGFKDLGPTETVAATTREPLRVEFKLFNARATAQAVPRDWMRRDERGAPQWRQGVELRLLHTCNEAVLSANHLLGMSVAMECAPRSMTHFTPAPDEALRTLDSEAEFVAAEFDLREFFDIREPGLYQLQMALPGYGTSTGQRYFWATSFRVRE